MTNGNLDRLIGKHAHYMGGNKPQVVTIQGWVLDPNKMWPQIVFSRESGRLNMDNINQFDLFDGGR